MANHDALTGLPNLALGTDRMTQAIFSARRHSTRTGLMFIDLDGFKRINDVFGHDAGDHVLREIGSRLTACLREMDTVARIGGDEFVVILAEITERQAVELVADKIISLVSMPMRYLGQELSVGASIGISMFPHDGNTSNQMFKQADMAMYEAKKSGKNTYRFSIDSCPADAVAAQRSVVGINEKQG